MNDDKNRKLLELQQYFDIVEFQISQGLSPESLELAIYQVSESIKILEEMQKDLATPPTTENNLS